MGKKSGTIDSHYYFIVHNTHVSWQRRRARRSPRRSYRIANAVGIPPADGSREEETDVIAFFHCVQIEIVIYPRRISVYHVGSADVRVCTWRADNYVPDSVTVEICANTDSVRQQKRKSRKSAAAMVIEVSLFSPHQLTNCRYYYQKMAARGRCAMFAYIRVLYRVLILHRTRRLSPPDCHFRLCAPETTCLRETGVLTIPPALFLSFVETAKSRQETAERGLENERAHVTL